MTTSTSMSGFPAPSRTTSREPLSITGVPPVTSGSFRPSMVSGCAGSVSTHSPPRVMPTRTTSYRSGSKAAITLPADTQEMACSALRPPNTTATRTLPCFPLIVATLVEPVWQPLRVQADGGTAAPSQAFSPAFRLAGAAVHLYTASGSVLGLLIVLAAFEGEVETALWLGLATLFIDGTDGMLARHFRVKETIPWFDGALLDNIVDYLTYVFAPIVLLWTTGYLPDGAFGYVVAGLPLLASCYQFCRVDAKTSDHFFLGWPSYWNVLAFYVIVLDFSDLLTAVTLVVFA